MSRRLTTRTLHANDTIKLPCLSNYSSQPLLDNLNYKSLKYNLKQSISSRYIIDPTCLYKCNIINCHMRFNNQRNLLLYEIHKKQSHYQRGA